MFQLPGTQSHGNCILGSAKFYLQDLLVFHIKEAR